MLKLISLTETNEDELSLNGYILSLNWHNLKKGSSLYWRVGNFKNCLLEIGISDGTHALWEVTIVVVSSLYFSISEQLTRFDSSIVVEHGMPICEWTWDKPSPWVVDERLDFHVHIASNTFDITIGDEADIAKIIESGRVQFAVTQDNSLSRIRINELLSSEVAKILATFPSDKPHASTGLSFDT
jgi:hypothetical protein